jgi:hypothetical protein
MSFNDAIEIEDFYDRKWSKESRKRFLNRKQHELDAKYDSY